MCGKIIGCLRYTLSRVISPQYLHIVYLDSDLRLHAAFYGNDFLDDTQLETVRMNTRNILTENKKTNSLLSCTCLPYQLRQRKGIDGDLYMDYLAAFRITPEGFSTNNIDLLLERQLFYEREFLDALELVSDEDTDSSSDEE